MSQPPLSELTAALQLLLGDFTDEQRSFIVREAFPNVVIVANPNKATLVHRALRQLHYHLHELAFVDGSSGIGLAGAQRAAVGIKTAKKCIDELVRELNVPTY